jgi:hypothetical protein
MAESPSHRFGQIIGEALEAGVLPLLATFARQHGLYLDKRGERACRKGAKVSWFDAQHNKHDLDFVLERGGSATKQGLPAAFIETAWRRYTKHSKNKAQEIQGAVLPLVDAYRNSAPFAGAILAGEFTSTALAQMRSLGFSVIHVPYQTVVDVFAKFGIDASSAESTPDSVFAKKVAAYERLSAPERQKLGMALIDAQAQQTVAFMKSLEEAVLRQIDRITVLPLHGTICELVNVEDAIAFIEGYNHDGGGQSVTRYEVQIKYNNGNTVDGRFGDKASAIEFLKTFAPVAISS